MANQANTASSKESINKKFDALWRQATGNTNLDTSVRSAVVYSPAELLLDSYTEDKKPVKNQMQNTDANQASTSEETSAAKPLAVDQAASEEAQKTSNSILDFFTKLGEQQSNYSFTQSVKEAGSPFKENTPVKDAVYDFVRSGIQNMIETNLGNILQEQNEQRDLNFQKQYLENYKSLNNSRSKLSYAMSTGDQSQIDEAYDEYSVFQSINDQFRPEYLKMVNERENYFRYYSDEDINKRLEKIDKRLKELDQDIAVDRHDYHQWSRWLNKVDSVYLPSDEWEAQKQSNWLYQIPSGLASSVPSLVSSIGAYAATTIMSSAAGSVAGPPGAAAGAFIGMGTMAANTLYQRNNESLAEVSMAYKSKVYDWLEQNGMQLQDITGKDVREKLTVLTGIDYTGENITADQILDAMVAYDIPFQQQELSDIAAETKNTLDDVYNRNMALVGVNLAENFLIIPGAGKMIQKALSNTNISATAGEYLYKGLDKAIDYTMRKAGASAARRASVNGAMKYYVHPVYNIGLTGLLEGGEEVTQYMISMNPSESDRTWYNPLDFADMMLENNYALFKGMTGVLGISNDPALNSDKELADNFKVGAAIGILMGSPGQINEGYRNGASYNSGRNLARQMMADQIQAKDDVYKYIQYGERANQRLVRRDALLDGIDTQLNEDFLPEGWTREDLQQEKQNINDIFDLIENNELVNSMNYEDKPIAAALLKHNEDLLERMENSYASIRNPEFVDKVQKAVDKFVKQNSIDAEHANIITAYFLNKYSSQAIDTYLRKLQAAHKRISTPEMLDLIDEMLATRSTLQQEKNLIDENLKQLGLDKKISSKASLRGVVNDIKRTFVQTQIAGRAVRQHRNYLNQLRTDEATMQQAIDKYKQSVVDNVDDQTSSASNQPTRAPYTSPTATPPIQPPVPPQNPPAPPAQPPVQPPTTPPDNGSTQPAQNNNLPPNTPPPTPQDDDSNTNPTPAATPVTQPANAAGALSRPLSDYPNSGNTEEESETSLLDDALQDAEQGVSEELFAESSDDYDADAYDAAMEKYYTEGDSAVATNAEPAVPTSDDSEPAAVETDSAGVEREQQSAPTVNLPVADDPAKPPVVDKDTPQGYVDRLVEGNQGNPNPRSDVNDNEGTVFYNPENDKPLMPGYRSGQELNTYSSTPGNIQNSTVAAVVDAQDSQYGAWKANDRSTWDNAAIYVTITAPDGTEYIATLKTIDGLRALRMKHGLVLSPEEENSLRELRNSIIEAHLANPNATITFEHVRMTNGFLNVNRQTKKNPDGTTYEAAINRPLTEVKGLNLPSDLHGLLDGEIAFAIGGGHRQNFQLRVMHNDPGTRMYLEGSLNSQTIYGGYGSIYIIPAASSNPSGLQNSAIMLNPKRFSDESDGQALANLAAQAILYPRTRDGFDTAPLRKALIFTDWEQISQDDPRFPLMASKQIRLFTENGRDMVQLGTEIRPLQELQNPQGLQEVTNFILQNSHWSMDMESLQTPLRDIFGSYFEEYADKSSIELAPGFKLTLSDLGMRVAPKKDPKNFAERTRLENDPDNPGYTLLEWMILNGKIQSDLQDQIYTSPFIYVGKPTIKQNQSFADSRLTAVAQDPVADVEKPATPVSKPSQETQSTNQPSVNQEQDNTDVSKAIENLYAGDGMTLDDFLNQTGFGAPKIDNQQRVANKRRINAKRAVKWLKSRLGLTDEQINIVNGVIRQFANGSAVYGICNADCISISDMAVEGVQYHEAWHRVSLLMLTPEMRQNLYSEFRKQYPQYSRASDKQVEEAIADRFMEYMLNDKQSKLRYYINKIFRDILHFIGINKGINPRNLNQIFEAIKYGDFKNYKLDQNSIEEFNKAYTEGGAYYTVGENRDYTPAHFPTLADFHTTVSSLKASLLLSNGVRYISDISKLDKSKLRSMLEGIKNSTTTTTQQKEAIQEIIDHWDDWMYEMEPQLAQLGVRAIDENENSDFQERETTGIQNYDKAAYEFSKKDNALGVVKLFLSTIPEYYYEYIDTPDGQLKKLKIRKDPLTGLPKVLNYDTIATQALNQLGSIETYSPVANEDPNKSLLGRCAEKAKTNSVFAGLYQRLAQVDDSNLETQILQTIKSASLNPIEVGYTVNDDGVGTFSVKDSTLRGITRMLPTAWSAVFFNSDLLRRTDTEIKPNTELLQGIVEIYDTLVSEINDKNSKNTLTDTDIDIYRNAITILLNEVGIDVHQDAVETLIKGTDGNRKGNLLSLVNGKSIRDNTGFFEIFNNILGGFAKNKATTVALDSMYVRYGANHIINKLAYAQAISVPSNDSLQVLGPNNNVYYLKIQNNYASDLTRRLNDGDTATMNWLLNDTYIGTSLIKGVLINNGKIKLNTLINFYGSSFGDKGRSYTEITPTEDYMMKMALTWNDHIVFPTMADKGTWNTISGCKLFNRPFAFNQGALTFDRAALDYMLGAWIDEFNTILQYWKTKSSVQNPIDNYHTKNFGGKFRHFTGYYEYVNGKQTWIDLNKNLDQAIKDGTVIETLNNIYQDLFSPERYDATRFKINSNLFEALNNELKTAVNLGLISENNSGYVNNLLDERVYNVVKGWYLNSTEASLASNADSVAVLTMIGNHMLNSIVSKLETEKIYTGDLAYYKNTDDQIKRLGAILSTGDNMRTQWLTNNPKFIPEYRRLQARQTYSCSILRDNKIASHQYDTIKDLFTYAHARNALKELHGLTEKEVDELMKDSTRAEELYPDAFAVARNAAEQDANAYGLSNGKGNINQADAAVYIRPQMYQDIVRMLGEWSDEVREAFEILESDEDWLSDPVKYQKSLSSLIKALKTTYFGYRFDPVMQHSVPVFNKMAMFPLFKILATGDNRALYDRMNGVGQYQGLKPIDQVAFESAVKVGIEGARDFYTDYTNEQINDLSNIPVTAQEFRNLRRQLITDPHSHERQLFGTQVSTIGVANLIPDRIYGEGKPVEQQRTGEQLKEQLFGTINALSNKGAAEVQEMFLTGGVLDWGKVSAALTRAARSSNMGRDVEDALQVNDDGDGLAIPLAALPDSKWVETQLISTTNKRAVDIELPGGAYIQMSSFGVKQINVQSSRMLNLRDDGSMDAIISINLFRNIIPNFDKLSFAQQKQWLIDHNLIGDKAGPIAIGYRIPTQGLSSTAGLHIKDVLPSNVGDMIILPDEFTSQTGSDFD